MANLPVGTSRRESATTSIELEAASSRIRVLRNVLTEVFDCNKAEFNELIADQDLVYLPGCSAPKGASADAFKKVMDDYFVKNETLEAARAAGQEIFVTHTLPRRAGEMDLRIDNSPSQLYFEAILHSVSLRMGLLSIILGL